MNWPRVALASVHSPARPWRELMEIRLSVSRPINRSSVRIRQRPPLDLFWYDGSLKPPTPEELETGELLAEGMMFIGDSGKILAGFRGDNPQIIPEKKRREYRTAKNLPEAAPQERNQGQGRNDAAWVAAFKGGKPTYGNFLLGGPISDAFNLGAVSLRLGGRRLLFDAASMRVTNLPEANKHLVRQYRTGWELTAVEA
jgi:hypothetical protein